MGYPTYQDLTEALHNPEFVQALTARTMPPNGVDDEMKPWSISLAPAVMSSLEPAFDPEQHAIFIIMGSNVSAIAQADPGYTKSLARNPNIRDGVGAYTWFGAHVLQLVASPSDRLTFVAVTMSANEENGLVITASASVRIACRVASLLSQETLAHLIAQHAHELNRQYCRALGDDSQPEWEDAPDWQKDSAIAGVKMHLANPEATPEDSHISWYAAKEADGWVYGEVKDPEAKTHPCMVPYAELPEQQRAKDYLFRSTVHQLAELLKPLTF